MQKQVKFTSKDIAHDPEAIAARLSQICAGHPRYFVRGICQVGETVSFMLLPTGANDPITPLHLVPLEDITDNALESEFSSRWSSGFDTLGAIHLGNNDYMAVFADVRQCQMP